MIESDPKVCGGLPRIAGTRLTVPGILDRLSVHGSIAKVVAYYNRQEVSEAAVKECLDYAQELMALPDEPLERGKVQPIPKPGGKR